MRCEKRSELFIANAYNRLAVDGAWRGVPLSEGEHAVGQKPVCAPIVTWIVWVQTFIVCPCKCLSVEHFALGTFVNFRCFVSYILFLLLRSQFRFHVIKLSEMKYFIFNSQLKLQTFEIERMKRKEPMHSNCKQTVNSEMKIIIIAFQVSFRIIIIELHIYEFRCSESDALVVCHRCLACLRPSFRSAVRS